MKRICPTSLLAAGAAVLCGVAGAYATDLAAGGTLEPVPVVALPAGANLEATRAVPFDFTVPAFPIARHVHGTVTQNIYRMPDNTLIFRYQVANDADSEADVTDIYARDFQDWTTDVAVINSNNVHVPDRAIRSQDGSFIHFQWDAGIPAGTSSRPAYAHTNATSYSLPNGPFYIIAERFTLCSATGCDTMYGLGYPVADETPPVVSITAPNALYCACNPVTISGTAYDTLGFGNYVVEYATNVNGPWTTITTSTNPVNPAGTLATWNTSALGQGYYFLRLTATNSAGLTNTITSVTFVDKQFDVVDFRSPAAGAVLGGTVCFDGSVQDGNGLACFDHYTVSYAPLPAGSPFLPVDPANPTYFTAIWNDPLGQWNTVSGGAAVADGSYRLRIIGADGCGNTRTVVHDVAVDNTPPVAAIASPASCSSVSGSVQVTGTASDAHMGGWALQYAGGSAHQWVTIASGSGNVNGGVLGNWNTAALPACYYALRLVVSDSASVDCGGTSHQAEYLALVAVGTPCRADFNHDNIVNSQDFFDFLTAFFAGC